MSRVWSAVYRALSLYVCTACIPVGVVLLISIYEDLPWEAHGTAADEPLWLSQTKTTSMHPRC